jgi:hypothetical protein
MVKVKTLFAISCAGLLLATLPCQSAEKETVEPPDTSKLPPSAGQTGVTYAKDISPIIEKSCLKCHSGDRPKSKYSMEELELIIKGGSSEEVAIVAGKSDRSPFVWYIADLVEEMEMPPLDKREKYPQLTKAQIALIRAWIDQGAK